MAFEYTLPKRLQKLEKDTFWSVLGAIVERSAAHPGAAVGEVVEQRTPRPPGQRNVLWG